MYLSVNCMIVGEDYVFPLRVEGTEYPDNLKPDIKNRRKDRLSQGLRQVDVAEIELRLVNISFDELDEKLPYLTVEQYPKPPRKTMATLFENGTPPDHCLHFLVVIPREVKLQCAVEANEVALNSIFTVEVFSRYNVNSLKGNIIRDNRGQLPHGIRHDQFTLYKVTIPLEGETSNEGIKVDLSPLKPLVPTQSLLRLFPGPDEGYLSIIIRIHSELPQAIGHGIGVPARRIEEQAETTSDHASSNHSYGSLDWAD